ncbi:MAG: hypothetical protein WCV68_03600 [Candidatus Paceibacterota bacterium]|jgi:hypothetical protein
MEQTPNNKIEDLAKKEISWHVGKVFDHGENEKERQDGINKFILKILPLLELIPDRDAVIRSLLTDCAGMEEREVFVEKVMSILEPLFKFKEKEPLIYEEARRKIFLEDARATSLNDFLAYSIEGQEVSLHLPHAREFIKTYGLVTYGEEITKALVLLANIISQNKDITGVVGTSWIIARNPKLLELFGFTVEHGQLPDQDSPMGMRPVSFAFMSREDFLNKYYKG